MKLYILAGICALVSSANAAAVFPVIDGKPNQASPESPLVAQVTPRSLSAPTYTHAWGPQAGCQDTATYNNTQLALEITDKDTATKECQDLCTTHAKCQAVFVQLWFPDYGKTTPRYECSLNNHTFDEKKDLKCGVWKGWFGEGDAWDKVQE